MNPGAFAATINLTIPLATLLDLADRPGEMPGIGPIDPWLTGRCAPPETGGTCGSPSTRSAPGIAITGIRPGATIPGRS